MSVTWWWRFWSAVWQIATLLWDRTVDLAWGLA